MGTNTTLTKNGLCGFDYQYHGEHFLKKVADFWNVNTANGHNIWEILFNRTRKENFERTRERILKFIYSKTT